MIDFGQAGLCLKTNESAAGGTAQIIAMEFTPRQPDTCQPDNGGMGPFVAGVIAALLVLLAATSLRAQVHAIRKAIEAKPNVAEASLDSYLERVRAANSNIQPEAGSIWTDSGRLTRMNTDVRAMRPHDLISVVVEENLAASTDGTVKNSRASNANSGISGLIGTLNAGNALQNLINQNSVAGLNAQGTSATNSSLRTVFGGQVVAVLPNGILVIEAARQVEFSQQTQTIILRGLVRPEDISQQNQVLSTAISSLELEVRGKGIINDYTRRKNVLVRLLERILIF
ncbi:MAG: flagellar basal body L-ring protein FlgH [Edaphobacter sp.]